MKHRANRINESSPVISTVGAIHELPLQKGLPPEGWVVVSLSEVAEINPKIDKSKIANDTMVSFVPMQAVGAGDGRIDTSVKKHFADVRKGYTPFQPNDVLFAKITPCMENGKIAVVPALHNNLGFGSTEFHVLRPKEGIDPHYICYYISRLDYRKEAASKMTGAVGQKRVPTDFIKSSTIPLAPLDQQKLIVAEIEKQFSRLDEAGTALKRIQANLKRYKASVLKAAVEGKLTEQWRKKNPDVEPASELLKRILVERKKKWETEHLGKKYKEPTPPDSSNLPELPKGWVWATIGQLCKCVVPNRDKPKSFSGNIPWITMPDFDDFSIDIYKAKSGMGLTEDEVRVYRARLIPKGSVVMSCIGRFGIAGVLQNRAVINQQLHAFMIPTGLNNRYIAYAIKTQVPYMESIATATTIHYLNKDNCNSVPIAVPPAEEQNAIVDEIERAFSVAHNIEVAVETNLKRADRLRQSILKQAFSGKLAK